MKERIIKQTFHTDKDQNLELNVTKVDETYGKAFLEGESTESNTTSWD